MGNIICAIHAILRLESTESLQKILLWWQWIYLCLNLFTMWFQNLSLFEGKSILFDES